MAFKLVVDSCCELPDKYQGDPRIEVVPFTMEVAGREVVDDGAFDQRQFLKWIAESPSCPKSSCPSPQRFMEACRTEADDVYVVTISSQLSGSHGSAILGRELLLEHEDKNIHVCDSEAAVSGEGQVAMKLIELAERGLPFAEVVKRLESYRDELRTYFVLDNLETLRKNGRLVGVKSVVAGALNIKPVMSAVKGSIVQKSQAIGIRKALTKMVDLVIKERPDTLANRLSIAHCNCLSRALEVRRMFEEKANYKEILIVGTKGLSTMYANDGGVVIGV